MWPTPRWWRWWQRDRLLMCPQCGTAYPPSVCGVTPRAGLDLTIQCVVKTCGCIFNVRYRRAWGRVLPTITRR